MDLQNKLIETYQVENQLLIEKKKKTICWSDPIIF